MGESLFNRQERRGLSPFPAERMFRLGRSLAFAAMGNHSVIGGKLSITSFSLHGHFVPRGAELQRLNDAKGKGPGWHPQTSLFGGERGALSTRPSGNLGVPPITEWLPLAVPPLLILSLSLMYHMEALR